MTVTTTDRFPGFAADTLTLDHGSVFVRRGGRGPALLMLHGFPETHLMWHAIAPELTDNFTVVCADLPGYGASRRHPDHHVNVQSKRAIANDLVDVMGQLGHETFRVVGHDRGGRVGYRLALDHPQRIHRLGVLDVLPTIAMLELTPGQHLLAYWPWALLAQESPLPERLLAAAPELVIDHALATWGSPPVTVPADIRSAYVEQLIDGDVAHSICNEYRAAATSDIDHDANDRAVGRRIGCPTLVLWAAQGPLDTWYARNGGPIRIWRQWARTVTGAAVQGGHFFPEQAPRVTLDHIRVFLSE